jgi:uncharacterized repeat protein (TIGR01451 family)
VPLSYRIIATNKGPAVATNVVVTDTLPAGVTFVSTTTTQGSCSGSAIVTCSLGSLAVGGQAIVTIVVTPVGTRSNHQHGDASAAAKAILIRRNNSATTNTLDSTGSGFANDAGRQSHRQHRHRRTRSADEYAFIGPNDFLILERATGKVQRIVNGALHSTPLDLAVNNASERGLLGIALHPNFSQNGFVYLYWTESSTGADTANIDQVPLARKSRRSLPVEWSTLTFDRNLIDCARCSRTPVNRRVAITTAVCCASVLTASSILSSATTADAVSCRILPAVAHSRRSVRWTST